MVFPRDHIAQELYCLSAVVLSRCALIPSLPCSLLDIPLDHSPKAPIAPVFWLVLTYLELWKTEEKREREKGIFFLQDPFLQPCLRLALLLKLSS